MLPVLNLFSEAVRLIGLFPFIVLTMTFAMLSCQLMFVYLGIAGPPED